MPNYYQRVTNLSAGKRILLAEQLREARNGAVGASPQIVAYAVPRPEQSVSDNDLRAYLRTLMPDYMVPHAVMLLDKLPRTPNGKVDRSALPVPRPSPLRPKTDPAPQPANAVSTILKQIWSEVLGFDEIELHDNFFEVGGDSILSIQIVAKARQAGLTLMPNDLFEYQTIAELSAVVQSGQEESRVSTAQSTDLVTGPIPLTPIQHWFFEQALPEPYHWNQAVLVQVPHMLDAAQINQAIQLLYHHHDALRLRFTYGETGWEQVNADVTESLPLTEVDLTSYLQNAQETAIAEYATNLHASLDLAVGPLVRAAFFKLGVSQANRLLLIVHHLVIDGVSWQILLADMDRLCQQLLMGTALEVPPKTSSFQAWSAALEAYAVTPEIQQAQNYWCVDASARMASLPVDSDTPPDDPAKGNTLASERILAVTLASAQTQMLLHEVLAAYHTQVIDLLLTALVQTLNIWVDSQTLLLGLEGHGREAIADNLDLSHTVGWFTAFYPAYLTLPPATDPGTALKAIKEQLRQIPRRGLDYGILRYLGADHALRQTLRMQPQSEILFNYLGRIDQGAANWSVLQPAHEPTGQARSGLGQRHHLLEINAFIAENQLQMNWAYSANLHDETTIGNLANATIEALATLIAHCVDPTSGGHTPSDFPDAELEQDVLDSLLAYYED